MPTIDVLGMSADIDRNEGLLGYHEQVKQFSARESKTG